MTRAIAALITEGDRGILLAYLALCLFSLTTLWSVTEAISGPYDDIDPGVAKSIFWRQMIWMLVSWVTLLVASRVPLRYIEGLAWPALVVSVLLLMATLVIAPEFGGARRWLVVGPLHIQPSELAKVAYIVAIASLLGKSAQGRRRLGATVLSLMLTLVPLLLVLREPDLGTSLVFPALWIGMVFWYGISGVFLLWAGSAALSGVVAFYSR